jgi:hypothetical protein
MLGLAILRAAPNADGLPVVHIAPERGLAHICRAKFGDSWTPSDIDTKRYEKSWVGKPVTYIDLVKPSKYLAPSSVKGFIHSHVLEHVPADLDLVISEMNAAVAPGGFQAFIVPINGPLYQEDLNLERTDEYRLGRFGHTGHVRRFGKEDFSAKVLSHFKGWKDLSLKTMFTPEELKVSGIPSSAVEDFTGATVFMFVKQS